jgi:hypothetical protein
MKIKTYKYEPYPRMGKYGMFYISEETWYDIYLREEPENYRSFSRKKRDLRMAIFRDLIDIQVKENNRLNRKTVI